MSGKIFMAATQRNIKPILEVLHKVIPDKFKGECEIHCLEIASGSGEHCISFAKEFPRIIYQPSDIEPKYIASIQAHREEALLQNLLQPVLIDISKDVNQWSIKARHGLDMMVAINMIHISPWECTIGLFKSAAQLLRHGGILFTYGPYSVNGDFISESNVKFNESLKARDQEWGIRDVTELEKEAQKYGLALDAMFDMPSNNKSLIWYKI